LIVFIEKLLKSTVLNKHTIKIYLAVHLMILFGVLDVEYFFYK
jgi:hypothetical protein